MERILAWIVQCILRRAFKRILVEANMAGKDYFTWQRSRQWRRWGKQQVKDAYDWAVIRTPKIQLDDDLFKCLAWALESDEMERRHNILMRAQGRMEEMINVHAANGQSDRKDKP